ncbi:MAG TPA: dipeptide epimerase [Lacipirellulaceae bacterium]|jgi:L-alanine-DL-glutamate epimerase-like enolase superfamily enzyme|nr:dipeptide epimerase [Lacipirellulaceae bacterium]
MQLNYRKFDLPLKHVFTISRGSTAVQETLIVELAANGHFGYGEATTNSFYGATIENMSTAIEAVRPLVESDSCDEPLRLIAALNAALPKATYSKFALSALDQAIHDLWGNLRGAPVYRLWGLSTEKVPYSDYTLGIDTVEKMVAKLKEMPGWPVYKIKLGTADDLAIIRELRRHTDAVFRVDANCGWTADQTIEIAPALKSLNVEFIEQPLPPKDSDGARRAFERSALPLIADESCITEDDVDRCAGKFHGINIKLVKCGGLAAARRMIARARELGLQVMVGCMTESTVGISALAQLLPLLDYVDMDGAVLLAKDIATGVGLERGRCIYPNANGTGVKLIDGPLSQA